MNELEDATAPSAEELELARQLILRKLARIYRMYTVYKSGDREAMPFSEYAFLFHGMRREIAGRWQETGST